MDRQDYIPKLSGHVVICNCNEKIKNIVEGLQCGVTQEAPDIVVIIPDRKIWDINPQWHPKEQKHAKLYIVFGSPTDEKLLKDIGMDRARAAIILADPKYGKLADAPSAMTAIAIERENPQVHTVMELILSVNREYLDCSEVNEIICLGEISEKLIALSCITPGVKNIFENLLSTEKGTPQLFIPTIPAGYNQKSFRQLSRAAIENEWPFIIIGYILKLNSRQIYVVNPKPNAEFGKDTPLTLDSKLIVIAYECPKLENYAL